MTCIVIQIVIQIVINVMVFDRTLSATFNRYRG